MKFFYSLLITISLFFSLSVEASHVAGGNIEYSHIAGDSFEIRIYFYRDCDGSVIPSNVNLRLYCAATGATYSLPVVLANSGEVSQICPSSASQSSCVSPGNGGIESVQLYTGAVIVDFAQYSPVVCDNWILSYTVSARNVMVNSINGDFHVIAELDNVNFPTNNSATYNGLALPFMFPVGQHMSFNISATDPDGDSLVYSLDTALVGPNSFLNYQFGYSSTNPMPPLTLDSFSGLVSIPGVPALTGGEDNYVLVFRADEYDPVSGMHKGTTIRDFQAVVVAAGNEVPELQSTSVSNVTGAGLLDSFLLQVIDGQNFCFDITFSDSNLLDSLFVDANFGSFASSMSVTQTGVNPSTATICGTMNSTSQVSSNLSFLVSARDNACPVYGATSQTIKLNVISLGNLVDQSICAGDSAQMNVPGTQVSWTAISGPPISIGNNFDCSTCNTVNAYPTTTTSYEVQFNLQGLGTITDTVTVSVAPAIAASIAAPAVICNGDTVSLSAQGTGSGLTYNWMAPGGALSVNGAPTTQVIYSSTGQYTLSVIVSNGMCAETATHSVFVSPPPTVTAGPNGMICTPQSFTLSGSGATSYSWTPASYLSNPNIANPVATPTQTTIYTVVGTDNNGCSSASVATVVVQPTFIIGIANDLLSAPIADSWVYMVKYLTSQDTVYALDSVLTDSSGSFQFLATSDSVFFKLVPDSANYPVYLPTYYSLSPLVQLAAVYSPTPCVTNNVVLQALPGLNPGGQGFVGGYVSQGAGRSEAVANLSMVLRNDAGEYVDQAYTDAQGYFRFDGLTDGGYYVDVDKWGISTTKAPYINISDGGGRDDYQFILYSKYLDLLPPTGIDENIATGVRVFPNPADELLNIQLTESRAVATVLSMDGKRLIVENLSLGHAAINLSELSSGAYVLEVSRSEGVHRQVIVKR